MIKKFTIEKITDITNTDVVMNYLKTLFKSIEIRLDGVVDEKTVSRKFNVEYESGVVVGYKIRCIINSDSIIVNDIDKITYQ